MDDVESAVTFLEAHGGEWIVKPDSAFASQGVGLVSADENSRQRLEWAASFGPILLEEIVTGSEYSAEGFCRDGVPEVIALTQKQVTPPPNFAEIGHVVPAGLDPPIAVRARKEVTKAVTAVGITHSSFHVEFWVTPRGEIVIGELHARPGGDYIPALVEAYCGIDPFQAALALLLKRDIPAAPHPAGAGAVHVVAPDHPGEVGRIIGSEIVADAPSLLAFELIVEPGDKVGEPRTSSDRLALVAASGRNRSDAQQRAAELAGALSFQIL
jgi:biotin carboxylase